MAIRDKRWKNTTNTRQSEGRAHLLQIQTDGAHIARSPGELNRLEKYLADLMRPVGCTLNAAQRTLCFSAFPARHAEARRRREGGGCGRDASPSPSEIRFSRETSLFRRLPHASLSLLLGLRQRAPASHGAQRWRAVKPTV